jgi:hypothetical protein
METCVGVPRGVPAEPEDVQPSLLRDEPSPTGEERWDALLRSTWPRNTCITGALLRHYEPKSWFAVQEHLQRVETT